MKFLVAVTYVEVDYSGNWNVGSREMNYHVEADSKGGAKVIANMLMATVIHEENDHADHDFSVLEWGDDVERAVQAIPEALRGYTTLFDIKTLNANACATAKIVQTLIDSKIGEAYTSTRGAVVDAWLKGEIADEADLNRVFEKADAEEREYEERSARESAKHEAWERRMNARFAAKRAGRAKTTSL